MENVGAFVCTGCDIGEAIDVAELEEICDDGGAKTFVTHACLCSPEGVAAIQESAESEGCDGLMLAACSARCKRAEIGFDDSDLIVERVPLREQVVWPQEPQHEDTQMLAEDMVRMGLARISKLGPPLPIDETIESAVLVLGGGLAGMNAALAAAGMHHPVVLVEEKEELGGYLAGTTHVVPEAPPYDAPHLNTLPGLIAEVRAEERIRVCTGTTVEQISGQPGQFQVSLKGEVSEQGIGIGAIVQATGALPYDASRLTELGYAESADVVTTHEMEAMLKNGGVRRPSNGETPRRIVFLQCAGSRDAAHLPYCSSECCATTLKLVSRLGELCPESESVVVYRDMRAPGQLEHFYESVQENSGCIFTRGDVTSVGSNGNGRIAVALHESLIGRDMVLDADLVVLATGMVPRSADGEAIRAYLDAKARSETSDSEVQRAEAAKVAEGLKDHEGTEILNLSYRQGPDLPVLGYNFPDSHYICFPYESRRTGVYAAGTVRAPMDAAQAAEDGWGAAMKAVQCIAASERGEAVHPRAGDRSIADFALQRCTQCKRCTEECPFGTLDEDEKGTPQYNALRCRRCGICLGACPERIISFPEYTVDAVASMIKAVEVPDEEDEKPRILAFMCENDALPALEEAAKRGLKWNPWIRVIPVRCLGAVNTVWIADSLSSGFDGVMLFGCRRGDDYQCHYIKGSELAADRMGNVQETLDRLALESERLKVIEIGRDEFQRVPELFEEFAETIEEVGPNPYKDF